MHDVRVGAAVRRRSGAVSNTDAGQSQRRCSRARRRMAHSSETMDHEGTTAVGPPRRPAADADRHLLAHDGAESSRASPLRRPRTPAAGPRRRDDRLPLLRRPLHPRGRDDPPAPPPRRAARRDGSVHRRGRRRTGSRRPSRSRSSGSSRSRRAWTRRCGCWAGSTSSTACSAPRPPSSSIDLAAGALPALVGDDGPRRSSTSPTSTSPRRWRTEPTSSGLTPAGARVRRAARPDGQGTRRRGRDGAPLRAVSARGRRRRRPLRPTDLVELEGGRFARSVFTGLYEDGYRFAYARQLEWLADSGRGLRGLLRMRFVRDERDTADPADFATELIWPVTRAAAGAAPRSGRRTSPTAG